MKYLFYIFPLFCAFNLQAQIPAYAQLFGETTFNEKGIASLQLADGSILMVGNVASTDDQSSNISLSKLSAEGDLRWTKVYGTDRNDAANNMTWMEDGHIAVVGESHAIGADNNVDGFVLKLDKDGNEIWLKTYGLQNRNESFYSIDQTTENGLIITGFVTGNGFGNDHYVVRLDGEGNEIWAKAYGTEGNEVGVAVRQTLEGNYVLIGDKQQGTDGPYGIEVLQLDANGNEGWQLDINDFSNGGCKNMILDSNGDIVIVGEAVPAKNEGFDVLLAKVNLSGNLIWQKFIDGTPNGDAGFDLIESGVEGGYLVVGYGFNPEREQTDILLGQVDVDGNEIETRFLGGNAFDIAYDIIPANDGGFLVTGFGFEEEDSQYFLAYDFPLVVNIDENVLSNSELKVFPNPIEVGQFLQTSYFNGGTAHFFDLQGRLLHTRRYDSLKEIEVPAFIDKGLYFLRIKTQSNLYRAKVRVKD